MGYIPYYYAHFRPWSSTPGLRASLFEETSAQAKEVMRGMAREMKGNWIGPCPVEHFFEHMHAPPTPAVESLVQQAEIPSTFFRDMHASSENDFFRILNSLLNGDSDYRPLPSNHHLVDASLHKSVFEGEAQIWPGVIYHKQAITSGTRKDLVLLAIEGKGFEDKDIVDDTTESTKNLPYDNGGAPYEIPYTTSTLLRGHLANYATQVCRRQHRTHLYMVYIFHPFVRFIRWDRAGAVVTKRVNYVKNCAPLIRFLRLFGQLDRVGKGFDPTVNLAKAADASIAKKHLQRWAPKTECLVFKMGIPSADGGKIREFLVWGAFADAESPLGRATRGYPAVEVVGGAVSQTPVFLKDQWRNIKGKLEAETLKELNAMGVEYVPTLICGGDLPGQMSQTHKISEDDWRVGNTHIDEMVHTRFVVAEVGRPLEQFASSRIMLGAIYDAFQGHRQAYEKCGILHRDISGGNILILDNDTGLLIDWDLAEKEAKIKDRSLEHERTGTWPFMSAALLQEPLKQHTPRDDLESFFWVALYYGLHYVPHSLFRGIHAVMDTIFDYYDFTGVDGIVRGGIGKMGLVHGRYFIGWRSRPELTFDSSPPLTDFVHQCAALLKQWRRRYDPTVEELEDSPEYIPVTHADMDGVWKEALQSTLWPQSDHAVDLVRRAKTLHRIHHTSPPEVTNLKRREIHDSNRDGDDEDMPRRKKRKTCHRW